MQSRHEYFSGTCCVPSSVLGAVTHRGTKESRGPATEGLTPSPEQPDLRQRGRKAPNAAGEGAGGAGEGTRSLGMREADSVIGREARGG